MLTSVFKRGAVAETINKNSSYRRFVPEIFSMRNYFLVSSLVQFVEFSVKETFFSYILFDLSVPGTQSIVTEKCIGSECVLKYHLT